jgi:hypothetical protein
MSVSQEQQHGGLSIRQELAGTLLLTGGLGFLGSVALESLLRNCPQVRASGASRVSYASATRGC